MKNINLQMGKLLLLSVLSLTAFYEFDENEMKTIKVNRTHDTISKANPINENKVAENGFVVLELFTSQGCSSCPPADKVMAQYATLQNPTIIPLAFHVDYWNYIGWKDPFSKSQFSERQRRYADQLNAQGNYTPQLVINGKYELIGSKTAAIENLVTKELAIKSKFNINIKTANLSTNQVAIDYDTNVTAGNTVVNVALVKKMAVTHIKRGENNGLKQTNYNIVFDFKTNMNYSITKTSLQFNQNWKPSDFVVVAYVQNTTTGQILTATTSAIN